MHRIAVLTSGGDAPGMNAALRAIVRYSIYHNIEAFAVQRGFKGLSEGDLKKMDVSSVGDIIHRGGTIIHSARCLEFQNDEKIRRKSLQLLKVFNIDGLIVIGGDGSFKGLQALCELGVNGIGIPGTIDNDLPYTEFTIGFDTAVNTAVDAISKLRDTASSHERVCIVEVMGRHCGNIALNAGLAGGAESVIVPEMPYDMDKICQKIIHSNRRGKSQSIIVVAEGVAKTKELEQIIKEKTHLEVRNAILGHIQRGGSPSAKDRILATEFGYKAVQLLRKNKSSRVVGINQNQIIDMEIHDALNVKRKFDEKMYELANILSI